MLEIQKIRTKAEPIIAALKTKGVENAGEMVGKVLELDQTRKTTLTELEQLRSESKQIAKSIGRLLKEGKKEEADEAKAKTSQSKARMKELEQVVQEVEAQSAELLQNLPNVPHPSVPVGKNPDDNEVIYQNDVKVSFDFSSLPHWDLAVRHDIIDWKLGVKVTGAGFPVYKGKGAILQRALITWFLTEAHKAGFTEYQPPLMVNRDSAFATGQLPDKEGQMYTIERDGFFMIPTAEVPITNLFRGDIVAERDLPIKACGYTPCFRREAGSYGKDVKGLNRLHQFDKVEIVQISHPDKSYEALEEMTRHSESLLERLGLPFRRLVLCTGDMTFTSSKTYDLEVYSAAQERWLEVSSVSNFETYQTNRLKLRYRGEEDKKTQLAHSLNGSALALPRIVAALLENNQQADGSIIVPEVLRPFTGFDQIGKV